MNIIPLTSPVQVHTKYSREVKQKLTRLANTMGVPQNTLANSILATHFGATGVTTVVKKAKAKRTKTRTRRK